MLNIIREENPDAEITVYPFYPKFNSVRKDYHLMAKSIEKAVDHKSDVICICLEVVGAKYLSADMLKVYKYASCQGIVICVSAGNNRPFLNPLIHKKYTIPIIGLTRDNEIPIHLKPENIETIFGIGVYGGRNHEAEQADEKIYCSAATARFAALLSKVLTKHKINVDLKKVNSQFENYSHEIFNDSTYSNL